MMLTIFLITLVITSIAAAISLFNFIDKPWLVYRPRDRSKPHPLVSILIPARNEAHNIKHTLYTIIQQTYRNIEIIVLDDNSDDDTFSIASSVAALDPRVSVIKGELLPEGWTGKNWACHQLARQAKGYFYLFIDADVQLAPEAVSSAVTTVYTSDISMLTVFPTQTMLTFGERLVVPLMNWLLLSFLPLRLVYSSFNASFVAANGQFILINSEVYKNIGGHQSVRDRIVEDMEIARNIKLSGKRVMTLLGDTLVSCRMYRNLTDGVIGFTKNFYPGFNIHRYIFMILLIVSAIGFLYPFVALIQNWIFIYPSFLILTNRLFVSFSSRQPLLFNIILHPLQMLLMVIIGFRSVEDYSKKQILWKGRRL